MTGLLLAFAISLPGGCGEEPVAFPGAGVRLVCPDGFGKARDFEGFQQEETQSSVMALRIAGPFAQTTAGFSAEPMKRRGMTLVSREEVRIEGFPALLLAVEQSAYGTDFSKWMLVFGDETETRMVMATFPKADATGLSARLRDAVLGTKLAEVGPPDVGFALTPSPGLKPATAFGKSLLFTREGTIPLKSREDPLFIAGPSIAKVPEGDAKTLAVRRIAQTEGTKVGALLESNAVRIDGLDGWELVAEATDAGTGTPLVVYQTMLFEKDRYLLLQGIAGAKARDEWLPEFRAMARSLRRTAK